MTERKKMVDQMHYLNIYWRNLYQETLESFRWIILTATNKLPPQKEAKLNSWLQLDGKVSNNVIGCTHPTIDPLRNHGGFSTDKSTEGKVDKNKEEDDGDKNQQLLMPRP